MSGDRILPYGRDEARAWARERMPGVSNVIIASYTADCSDINEAGIRHDVRQQIAHGFTGFLAVAETPLTNDEYIRFVKAGVDEAQGRQLVINHGFWNTLEETIAVANRAAAAGAELTLLCFPLSFYPKDEAELENYIRTFCERVDMAVMLFPVPGWGFERIHPSSHSLAMLERLVDDCPTIVAIKAEGGYPALGGFTEVWSSLRDRVIVTMPLEHEAVPMATILPLTVSATSNTEYYGAQVPKAFAAAVAGRHDEAMKLYWQMDPARRANLRMNIAASGHSINRAVWKYMAWLSGYNGGPIRGPGARVKFEQMRALRGALVASGLPCTSDPDEAFFISRNPA